MRRDQDGRRQREEHEPPHPREGDRARIGGGERLHRAQLGAGQAARASPSGSRRRAPDASGPRSTHGVRERSAAGHASSFRETPGCRQSDRPGQAVLARVRASPDRARRRPPSAARRAPRSRGARSPRRRPRRPGWARRPRGPRSARGGAAADAWWGRCFGCCRCGSRCNTDTSACSHWWRLQRARRWWREGLCGRGGVPCCGEWRVISVDLRHDKSARR